MGINDPNWLMFFRGVETTDHIYIYIWVLGDINGKLYYISFNNLYTYTVYIYMYYI